MNVLLLTGIERKIGVSKYAGTYRIATELQEQGIETHIIDHISKFSFEECIQLVEKYVNEETLFVGLSSTLLKKNLNAHYFVEQEFLLLSEAIKTKNSNCKFIIGGSRVGMQTQLGGVDHYFINKADKSIVSYANWCRGGDPMKLRYGAAGKVYVDGNDYLVTSEDFRCLQIDYNSENIEQGESLPIELARGCIFKCSFCQFDLIGKKKLDYLRAPDSLYSELMKNYDLYGTTSYLVSDELVNESVEKLKLLLTVFNKLPFEIEWSGFARLDLIHVYPEMREMLLDLNPNALIFGVETLSKKAGIKARKGLDPEKIKKTLYHLKEKFENRVIMKGSFIIGLPGESEAQLRDTHKWLDSNENPLDLYQYSALQVTKPDSTKIRSDIGENPDKYSIDLKPQKNERAQALNWQHEFMDYGRAQELRNEFESSTRYQEKSSLMPAHYFGAIKNLGLSTAEIKSQVFAEKTVGEAQGILSDWQKATENKLLSYKKKILQ